MKNNELIALIIIVLIVMVGVYGIVSVIYQPKQSANVLTPSIMNVPVIKTSEIKPSATSTLIATIALKITATTPDCQCDLSGGCKEINSKIEELIGMSLACTEEMVKRSKAAGGGETNLSYYTSNNPACDAVSWCTNHCRFELQQYYDSVCLSGYQV